MSQRSFMKSLFTGDVGEELVVPYPTLTLDERDNVRMMAESVTRFFDANVDSAALDSAQRIPAHVLRGLKQLGLFGMTVPVEYGGIGLSTAASARVMQEVAGLDAAVAVTLGVHLALVTQAILLFGSEAQKKRFLPRLSTGEWIAAFALTEPSAGSDASAIRMQADLGRDGESYRLSGNKTWVTNGGIADVFLVFARTSVLGSSGSPRITGFLVERGPGVTTGPPMQKLGIRAASTTDLLLDQAPVPTSSIVGDVGRGFRVAMQVLNVGRLSLAAGCVGLCKRLIRLAVERAHERRAFGRQISDFELVKDKIGAMAVKTWALESATYLTSGLADANADYSLESAICKVLGAETLWGIAHETLQIAGGAGYACDHPYERHLRDARVNLIFEGTDEIVRMFVALGGLQGPSRAQADVARAIREPIKGIGLLSDFAIRKARTALGRAHLNRIHPTLASEAAIFDQFSAELARQVDRILRKHGGDMPQRELIASRLADVAADLFALAACLSRATSAVERLGENGADRELSLTRLFAAEAAARLQATFEGIEHNRDEQRLLAADRVLRDGRYALDTV